MSNAFEFRIWLLGVVTGALVLAVVAIVLSEVGVSECTEACERQGMEYAVRSGERCFCSEPEPPRLPRVAVEVTP